jgi:hypothetical protein
MHAVRSTVVTTATCALAAVVLAGCGGSSSGGSGGSGSALSKADLDTQANAICVAEETAGKAVPEPKDISDATQAAAYFDQIDPIIQGATAKLEALTPDSATAADWNAFLTDRKAFSNSMHDIREKADAKDKSGLTELENLSTDKLAADATAVGATSCGESA